MTSTNITAPSAADIAAGFDFEDNEPVATRTAAEAHADATVGTPAGAVPFQDLVSLPGVGDIDLVTSEKAAAPQLSQSADGSYHLVLTWTKATKAHVGTAVAAIVAAGEFATTFVLPDDSPYTTWAQTALGVVGLVGIWLGVYLPTNKAKSA